MPSPASQRAEPPADPGQRGRDGDQVQLAAAPGAVARRWATRTATSSGQPCGRRHPLGDRGGEARPTASASSAPGRCEHRRGPRRPAGRAPRSGPRRAPAIGAVGEQHERRALLEDVLGDPVLGVRAGCPAAAAGCTGRNDVRAVGRARPAAAGARRRRRSAGRCRRRARRRRPTRPRRRPSARRRRPAPRAPPRGDGSRRARRAHGARAAGSSRPRRARRGRRRRRRPARPGRAPSGTASYQSPPAARAERGPVVAARTAARSGSSGSDGGSRESCACSTTSTGGLGRARVVGRRVVGLEHEQRAGAARHAHRPHERRSPTGPSVAQRCRDTVSGRPVRSTSSTTSRDRPAVDDRAGRAVACPARGPGRSPRPARRAAARQ